MKSIIIGTALLALSNLSLAAAVIGQGTWETTLLARDLDGDLSTIEAYYDDVLDITWLADANYAFNSGYSTVDNGRMVIPPFFNGAKSRG